MAALLRMVRAWSRRLKRLWAWAEWGSRPGWGEDGGLGLEVGAVGGAAGVGEVEVAYEQGIGGGDEMVEEVFAGEGVGGALGVVEDEAV